MNKVVVAGSSGMVGTAIMRALEKHNIDRTGLSRADCDFTQQRDVANTIEAHKPGALIIAAAKVGGIHANNTYPADFISENLAIQTNLITAAYSAGVEKLIFLGSSCIYPREAPQPMREEALLTGPLELTNEPYALAKIAGIKMCESYRRQHGCDFRSLMPTNLYGPGDNYHPENSHVIPALLRRFHEARENGSPTVTIWGTGNAKREFLHVDDLAEACVSILQLDQSTYWSAVSEHMSHINVGTGVDVSIRELAELIQRVVGFKGSVDFDHTKPDGTPRKLLDTTKINGLGWRPEIELEDGLTRAYAWFQDYLHEARV